MVQAIDFSNFKFRCSALGNLVSASGQLTDSNKTFIRDTHIGAVYNIQKEITSKYFEKGIMCEMDGIKFIKDVFYPNDYVPKNTERFENDYIHGEPDQIMRQYNEGNEIKNAYDLFTFGKANLSHMYKMQMIGYVWLTGIPKWRLVYCLSDMPDVLLGEEEKRLWYSGKFTDSNSPEWIEAQMKLHKKYDYSEMSLSERFKYWELTPTTEDFEKIKTSVIKAREYMQELELERMEHIKRNLEQFNNSRQ